MWIRFETCFCYSWGGCGGCGIVKMCHFCEIFIFPPPKIILHRTFFMKFPLPKFCLREHMYLKRKKRRNAHKCILLRTGRCVQKQEEISTFKAPVAFSSLKPERHLHRMTNKGGVQKIKMENLRWHLKTPPFFIHF